MFYYCNHFVSHLISQLFSTPLDSGYKTSRIIISVPLYDLTEQFIFEVMIDICIQKGKFTKVGREFLSKLGKDIKNTGICYLPK